MSRVLAMWMKWMPWKFLVRRAALAKGFLDPLVLLSHLRRFGQPSEVHEPWELLRAGALFHARGLVNSRAIQHNLDWVWPYWVERQFDPKDAAFVPRSFSITHINLTHRNWTAVGVAGCPELPIIDPRGLLTPLFDGWSLDAWIFTGDGRTLLPSRLPSVEQKLELDEPVAVRTRSEANGLRLTTRSFVAEEPPRCRMTVTGKADAPGWLVVALRPYNPEGISFVHKIESLPDRSGWEINGRSRVIFSSPPSSMAFSNYVEGDVFSRLPNANGRKGGGCDIGMATAAALFELKSQETREITVDIPFADKKPHHPRPPGEPARTSECRLRTPDERLQFLYDAAVRSLTLHSLGENVYPGPYTYKRFWFRDAAFIVHALLAVGREDLAEPVLDGFPRRQTALGYFLSQEGEWDSNGEALWILQRFCELTGRPPKPAWREAIEQGARWIQRKRVSKSPGSLHQGLLPAGFSAEHLGLNDYYYWDDFWGVAGLRAASALMKLYGDGPKAEMFATHAREFFDSVEKSRKQAARNSGFAAIPASPYRRMDSGAIGSLAASYPLQLLPAGDLNVRETVAFLMKECFVDGGFFQDMVHSGINPYLTLHVAQVLLRDGDPRAFALMKTVADLASSTGQWPEAVHPRTRGGCMGDGQHVWASAEWVLMIRNCFLREEGSALILCSGIGPDWREHAQTLSFGPAPTSFGKVLVSVKPEKGMIHVAWDARWFGKEPKIEVRLPGFEPIAAKTGQTSLDVFPRAVLA